VLWNLYLVFFINLMNSVSLRMMIEIDRAPAQSLSADQLLAAYSDDEALESRLQALVAARFIARDGAALSLQPKGRMLAFVVNSLRRLFGIQFYG
jgi:hypothetical protein